MEHEKIIKRPNGDKVRIGVSLWVAQSNHRVDADLVGNLFRYDVYVGLTPSGKRKELNENFYQKNVCTEAEVNEVKMELWNKINPVPEASKSKIDKMHPILSLANKLYEEMEELAKEHFNESNPDNMWDDDQAYGKYTAYSDSRVKLLEVYKQLKTK